MHMVKQDIEVLVVEDNPIYAMWLTGLLRKEGDDRGQQLRINTSSTLGNARSELSSRSIDAVLLDLNLPDSAGLETVAALVSAFPKIPIVVISSTTDEDLALRAVGMGAQEYLFKGRENEGSVLRTVCRSIERKYSELQLQLAQQAAMHNERMAAVGTLASGVAHEYNNLGAIMLGHVERTLQLSDLPAVARGRLDQVSDAIKRGRAITTGLLNFVNGFRSPKRTIDLREVVRGTLAMAEPTIAAELIELTVSLAEAPLSIAGNASELGQVLLNLIINACQALASSPQRRLAITLRGDADGQGVVLAVQDSGIGIHPDDLPRIFLPFFSTKGEHARDGRGQPQAHGTGLGLSVCDTVIRQHQGTITVESRPGEGSTFRIWLPLVDTVAFVATTGIRSQRMDLAGRTVLVVDDEPEIRFFLVEILREAGAILREAGDGQEAIAMVTAEMPDLILLDWMMPNTDGHAFLTWLMGNPEVKRPAVIITSGLFTEESARSSLERFQPAGILPKPFSIDDLFTQIVRSLPPDVDRP